MRLRRYPNRTLFDLDRSVWMTLAQVHEAVATGEGLQVVTGKDDRDCTALVVLQFLYQEALTGTPLQAKSLLRYVRTERVRLGAEALKQLDEKIAGPRRTSKGK